MAAVLAGDFFALAETGGGFGCVAEVWQVFASRFAQVIGVAGNQDNVRQVSRGQGALLDRNYDSYFELPFQMRQSFLKQLTAQEQSRFCEKCSPNVLTAFKKEDLNRLRFCCSTNRQPWARINR